MKPGYRAVMEMVVWVALLLSLCTQTHAQQAVCEDQSPQCPDWANQGQCNSNFDFMLFSCPITCNFCVEPECYDQSQRCPFMAARGSCRTQPNFMLSTCPRSCNNCTVGVPLRATRIRSRTIISPDFDCGRGYLSPSPASITNNRGNRKETVNKRVGRQVIFPDNPDYIHTSVFSLIPNPDETSPLNRPIEGPVRLTAEPTTQPPSVIKRIPGETEAKTTQNLSDVQVSDTFCGATPITDRFLITAAHCVLDSRRPVHTVRLGELDFSKDNEENSRPADYQVQQIIVHPDYKHTTVERYHDLALIKTVETIAFNDLVFPFCVSANRPPPETLVTGAGFGFVNATHQATRLQEAEVLVVDTAECEDIYRQEELEAQLRLRYPELLKNRDVICAAFPERDACKGDSGAPLFLTRNNRRFLVGVVATGVSCRGNGVSVLPGLYTSVSDHIDFIDSVVYGLQ